MRAINTKFATLSSTTKTVASFGIFGFLIGWVSKTLSTDIEWEFNFVYKYSKRDWDKVINTIRPEEELLDNIIEILQWWNKECEFFYNEFVK